MKRFEKQAAQHELMRQAAFAIVRREGPHLLSRRGLAAELGAADALGRRVLGDHVRLPSLAASECESRRRRAGRHRRSLVDLLLPAAPGTEVDVEVVWLRLLLAYGVGPADESGPSLAESYQLSVHDRAVSVTPPPDRRGTDREADRLDVAPMLEEHATTQRNLVTQLVAPRDELVDAVLAVVDGLVLAVCTRRLSPHDARTILLGHLGLLGVDPG